MHSGDGGIAADGDCDMSASERVGGLDCSEQDACDIPVLTEVTGASAGLQVKLEAQPQTCDGVILNTGLGGASSAAEWEKNEATLWSDQIFPESFSLPELATDWLATPSA